MFPLLAAPLIEQGFLHDDPWAFVIGVDPGPPLSDLIGEIAEFLVQSAARPRGTRGQDLMTGQGR